MPENRATEKRATEKRTTERSAPADDASQRCILRLGYTNTGKTKRLCGDADAGLG